MEGKINIDYTIDNPTLSILTFYILTISPSILKQTIY